MKKQNYQFVAVSRIPLRSLNFTQTKIPFTVIDKYTNYCKINITGGLYYGKR